MARRIFKKLLIAQDVAHGIGKITQERNGTDYELDKVDIPLGLATEAEVTAIDNSVYPRVRVGSKEFQANSVGFQATYDVKPVIYAADVELTVSNPYVYYDKAIYKYIESLPATLTGNSVTDGLDPVDLAVWQSYLSSPEPAVVIASDYPSVSAMKANTTAVAGDSLSTAGYRIPLDGGGAPYYVYDAVDYPSPNEINEIALASGKVAVLRVIGDILLEQWGCSADPAIDSRPYAQAAIEKAQQYKATGGKRTLTSLGDTYTLRTTYPGVLPSHAAGKKVGLWLEDAEWCEWDLKSGRFIVATIEAMENLDEILCICQEAGDQAFISMRNTRFDGGQWEDITKEPDYNIRADYNVVKYGFFERVNLRRAAESNLKMAGFVYQMSSCDFRFASGRANYELIVTTVDGDNATRTGYCLKNCVSNYAGLHGFQISGSNGTTYASMDTCTADHIGRDRDGVTITANVPTAAAYRLSAVFGLNMKSCGAEWSTRFGRFTGARSFTMQNCYTVAMGSNDVANTVVDANLEFDGLTEDCRVEGFREGTYSNMPKAIQVTIPVGFNNTGVVIDNSIAPSRRWVVNSGTDSSAPFVLQGLESGWTRGVRNLGIGDARVVGYPEEARQSSLWFDHEAHNPEIEFRFSTETATVAMPLLTLYTPTNLGYAGFYVEVIVGRSAGTSSYNPSRYQGQAACAGGAKTITGALEKLGANGDPVTMTLTWVGNSLVLETSTDYVVAAVKIKALTNPGSANQLFRWGA